MEKNDILVIENGKLESLVLLTTKTHLSNTFKDDSESVREQSLYHCTFLEKLGKHHGCIVYCNMESFQNVIHLNLYNSSHNQPLFANNSQNNNSQ